MPQIRTTTRLAQGMPPMPMGAPPAGAPPMGMDPTAMMGAMPTDPMAAPGAPPPGGAPPPPLPPSKPAINGPLQYVAEILYDADAQDIITKSMTPPAQMAMDIWQMYGGTDKGGVDPSKVGARDEDTMLDPEQAQAEQHATRHAKWKRLPEGKTIADVTSLDELTKLLEGATLGVVRNLKPPAGGPPPGGGPGGPPPGGGPDGPPPGGGPPPPGGPPPGGPTAGSLTLLVRLAYALDQLGHHRQADTVIR